MMLFGLEYFACPCPVITVYCNLSPAAEDILVPTVISGHHHLTLLTMYRGLVTLQWLLLFLPRLKNYDWLIDIVRGYATVVSNGTLIHRASCCPRSVLLRLRYDDAGRRHPGGEVRWEDTAADRRRVVIGSDATYSHDHCTRNGRRRTG